MGGVGRRPLEAAGNLRQGGLLDVGFQRATTAGGPSNALQCEERMDLR